MTEEFLSFLLTGEISNSFFSFILVENVLLSNKIFFEPFGPDTNNALPSTFIVDSLGIKIIFFPSL